MQSELERLLRATAHRFPDPDTTVTTRVRDIVLEQWRATSRRRRGWARRGAFQIALAVLVAASFGVGKMTAAAPPPVSVQPEQLAVEQGRHAVFDGRVPNGRSGERVSVFAARCGDAGFALHRTVTTTAGGRFRVAVGPIYGRTQFRFESGRSRSGVTAVGARVLVTLTPSPDARAFGIAVYANGADVAPRALLQRFDRGSARWTTLARVPLLPNVGFLAGDAAVTPRPGVSYRAVVDGGGACATRSLSNVVFAGGGVR